MIITLVRSASNRGGAIRSAAPNKEQLSYYGRLHSAAMSAIFDIMVSTVWEGKTSNETANDFKVNVESTRFGGRHCVGGHGSS